LRPGRSFALAVKVEVGGAIAQDFAPLRAVVAEQVAHLDVRRGEGRGPERQAADRADVVLELGGERALDRPVAAVVDPRRHLVEQRPLGRREEFERQHSDIVERIGDFAGERLGFGGGGRKRLAGGHGGAGEDAAMMLVAGHRPGHGLAVGAAAEQDRELGVERHKGLENRRRAAHRGPGGVGIAGAMIRAWPLPS
jgi:hypothetical protein